MKPEELSGVLTEFAQTMVTDFPIQGILDRLVARIVEIMPVTAAGVTLIAPDRRPRYIAASDQWALRYEQLQTQVSEGPCLAAYETGEPVSVPDLGAEQRFPEFAPRALTAGLAAVFTFPLRHGAMRLGALDLVISDEYHALRLRELELTADYQIKVQEERETAREERGYSDNEIEEFLPLPVRGSTDGLAECGAGDAMGSV